jgi:hypothetical protein
VVHSPNSPLRRLRGIDTLVAVAAKKCAYMTQEMEVWKELRAVRRTSPPELRRKP